MTILESLSNVSSNDIVEERRKRVNEGTEQRPRRSSGARCRYRAARNHPALATLVRGQGKNPTRPNLD